MCESNDDPQYFTTINAYVPEQSPQNVQRCATEGQLFILFFLLMTKEHRVLCGVESCPQTVKFRRGHVLSTPGIRLAHFRLRIIKSR